MVHRFSVSTAVVIALIAPVWVQGTAAPQLMAAIAARQDAMDRGDVATWERYTTDDFVSVNTDGTVGHKTAGPERDRVLANKGSNRPAPTRIHESIRAYGDATAIQMIRVTPPAPDAPSNRVTATWIREQGVWKVASSHGCVIQR
jgi:hypothetical protein